MRIRFVSFTGAVLALLYACTSEPAPRKDPVTRAGHVPECLVKEQRLVLNDGSAICLDRLAYYGVAPKYLQTDKHPTGQHPVGRIALPHPCNLANGSVLKPGWYCIAVAFRPDTDTLYFERTTGIECLESIYEDLSSDIDFRMSGADVNQNGTIDDKERLEAFHSSGVFTDEGLRDPCAEALKKPQLRPTYHGGDGHGGPDGPYSPSTYTSVWGGIRETVAAPLFVKTLKEPQTRSSLDLLPTETKGTFILEVVFGLYRGTTSLSIMADSD